jgi:hypothetical protein
MDDLDIEIDDSDAYKWKPVLHNLYVVQNMTDKQIADLFDVSRSTIAYHRRKNDIEGTPNSKYAAQRPAPLRQTIGYEYWDARSAGEDARVYVHRLLAVAEHGIEEVKDSEVHHINGVRWDNRHSNIEVMEESEHKRHHANARRDATTGRFK